MRGSSHVAVVLALLVPAGCSLLRDDSGGYAAGNGTAGVDGQDGSTAAGAGGDGADTGAGGAGVPGAAERR